MTPEFHRIRRLPPYVLEEVNRIKARLRGLPLRKKVTGTPHALFLPDHQCYTVAVTYFVLVRLVPFWDAHSRPHARRPVVMV